MSFGEREEGLAAAAVSIRGRAGDVVAALTISGPSARLTAERFEALRGQLTTAAVEIGRALGWDGGASGPVGSTPASLGAGAR